MLINRDIEIDDTDNKQIYLPLRIFEFEISPKLDTKINLQNSRVLFFSSFSDIKGQRRAIDGFEVFFAISCRNAGDSFTP